MLALVIGTAPGIPRRHMTAGESQQVAMEIETQKPETIRVAMTEIVR